MSLEAQRIFCRHYFPSCGLTVNSYLVALFSKIGRLKSIRYDFENHDEPQFICAKKITP